MRVSADEAKPVLVPMPDVADVVLTPRAEGRFEEWAQALRELAAALVDQVNLVVPAALAIAQARDRA